MPAVVMVAGVAAGLVFTSLGGPRLLDAYRSRRRQSVAHQIAITDALDELFGPIATPVVQRSIGGPWEIRITVSHLQMAAVGSRLPAIVDKVFTRDERDGHQHYRIVLQTNP